MRVKEGVIKRCVRVKRGGECERVKEGVIKRCERVKEGGSNVRE